MNLFLLIANILTQVIVSEEQLCKRQQINYSLHIRSVICNFYLKVIIPEVNMKDHDHVKNNARAIFNHHHLNKGS